MSIQSIFVRSKLRFSLRYGDNRLQKNHNWQIIGVVLVQNYNNKPLQPALRMMIQPFGAFHAQCFVPFSLSTSNNNGIMSLNAQSKFEADSSNH